MLIYWNRKRRIDPRRELERLRGADPVDVLIGLGEVEAGVADLSWPERDGDSDLTRRLRQSSVAAATAWLRGAAAPIDVPEGLPERVEVSIPEGYVYYGLYPDTYAEAARRFVAEAGPDRAVVVGIRSIGTSLSAVVAAALERAGCETATWTVRPRGHPFSRRIELAPELERAWRERAGWWWAIVDEGPGLSGSSMTSVAEKLGEIGVPDGRIMLFPSWEPSGEQFVSEEARARWQRHRKYTAEYRPPGGLEEISAGGWRRLMYPEKADWPAVQPQHERRKFLEDGRVLWKFSGLGRFGRARQQRAERLWQAGFGPRPLGLENGFLRMEWTAGTPVREATPDFVETLARYLRFLKDEFAGGEGAPADALAEMIRVNTGRGWEGPLPDGPRCAIDGRLLPHEWIRTPAGYLKTDGLDHHDDHFLPGCQNIAWDVAGAAVEFGADAECLGRLCGAAELPFYMRAYVAFRAGYAALAQTAIAGTEDAERFRALEKKYRRAV